MVAGFTEGKDLDELINEFNCSKITIVRILKKYLGAEQYKVIISKIKRIKDKAKNNSLQNTLSSSNDFEYKNSDNLAPINNSNESSPFSKFTEITPLNFDIENSVQKDLSSVPISDVDLPNIVYMIVDKKIELEIKYLRDYPDWQFLSQEDLDRKTIEIFFDIKIAKRNCSKEQKVIKVPNPNVFKIAATSLLNKGISRIVSEDKLIAL